MTFIGIDVTGLDELAKKLKQLPDAVADAGTEAATSYIRGVMQKYPPMKYVTRKAAYGVSFFTDKQRRWFFWALRSGQIEVPYRRTNSLSNAWKLYGHGRNQILANDSPGAAYVQGNWKGEQSRHENKVGWKGVNVILQERLKQIIGAFDIGVSRALKKLRLK